MSTVRYRINLQIQAKELRVLREDGTQLGVITKEQALQEATKSEVDLVEIAPMAVPPVAKLIDYKKFLYQLAKKERESKSAQKKIDLKEIRLTPFMGQNDFDTKMNQAKKFLTGGDKVRIAVKFVGRQLTHKEFAEQVWQKAVSALSEVAKVDQDPKWVGKQYIGGISPVKK